MPLPNPQTRLLAQALTAADGAAEQVDGTPKGGQLRPGIPTPAEIVARSAGSHQADDELCLRDPQVGLRDRNEFAALSAHVVLERH